MLQNSEILLKSLILILSLIVGFTAVSAADFPRACYSHSEGEGGGYLEKGQSGVYPDRGTFVGRSVDIEVNALAQAYGKMSDHMCIRWEIKNVSKIPIRNLYWADIVQITGIGRNIAPGDTSPFKAKFTPVWSEAATLPTTIEAFGANQTTVTTLFPQQPPEPFRPGQPSGAVQVVTYNHAIANPEEHKAMDALALRTGPLVGFQMIDRDVDSVKFKSINSEIDVSGIRISLESSMEYRRTRFYVDNIVMAKSLDSDARLDIYAPSLAAMEAAGSALSLESYVGDLEGQIGANRRVERDVYSSSYSFEGGRVVGLPDAFAVSQPLTVFGPQGTLCVLLLAYSSVPYGAGRSYCE